MRRMAQYLTGEAFTVMRETFLAARRLSLEELQEALWSKQEPLSREWREAMMTLPQYCVDCHKEHLPTDKCVPCQFTHGFLHAPVPKDIYFDYRGWRWTPPFICMNCGIEVCHRQWAFSRSCGSCDVSKSLTARLVSGKCFVGPHEKLPTWSAEKHDIPEDHFVDPKNRAEYPVIYRPRPKPFRPKSRRCKL